MSDGDGISNELRPYVDRGESEAIDRIGERLEAERPLPRAGFRAQLQSRLATARAPWRPQRLGLAVAAYLGSGLALLGVAAIGLAGAGPLGY
jgi:hypothetical protein